MLAPVRDPGEACVHQVRELRAGRDRGIPHGVPWTEAEGPGCACSMAIKGETLVPYPWGTHLWPRPLWLAPAVFPQPPLSTALTLTHFVPTVGWNLPLGVFHPRSRPLPDGPMIEFKPPAGSADLQTTGFTHFFGGKKDRKKAKEDSFFQSIIFPPNRLWPVVGLRPGARQPADP